MKEIKTDSETASRQNWWIKYALYFWDDKYKPCKVK